MGRHVAAPPGGQLTAGTTYENAHRYPFNDASPGFDLGGYGRGCNESTSRFTVDRISLRSERDLVHLPSHLRAALRARAARPPGHVDVQRRLTPPRADRGTRRPPGPDRAGERLDPAEAIRRLTPLQGQHPPAPFVALAARLQGFTSRRSGGGDHRRERGQDDDHAPDAAPRRRRRLPGLRAAGPARRGCGTWRKLLPPPRGGACRRRALPVVPGAARQHGDPAARRRLRGRPACEPWGPIIFARTLLPLIQLPPAGHWDDNRRGRASCSTRARGPDRRRGRARARALPRRLRAREQARVAAWAGVAQRDFAAAWERLQTVTYRERRRTPRPPGRPAPSRRHTAAPAAAPPVGTSRCSPMPIACA